MATPEFRVKLSLDDSEVTQSVARATAANDAFLAKIAEQANQASTSVSRLGGAMSGTAAGGMRTLTTGAGQAAGATRLTRQEIQALNYTVSDVAASLASGASPFTILLQQGGQLKDQFGGVGALFSKLGSMINPVTLGVTALAVVVGGLTVAARAARTEQEALDKAVNITGNFAALTNDRVDELAKSLDGDLKVGAGAAREMLVALADTGRVSAGSLDQVAKAALLSSKVSGESASTVAKSFAAMSDGVARWAEEQNKRFHFLSVAQLQYIQQLEEQGKREEAARIASEALSDHLRGAGSESVYAIGRAWDAAARAAGSYWEAIKSSFRDETTDQQIERLRVTVEANKRLAAEARENARGAGAFGSSANEQRAREAEQRAADAELEIRRLQESRVREQGAANTRAARARADEAAIAANERVKKLAEETTGQSLLNQKIAQYRKDIEAIRVAGGAIPSEAEQAAQIQKLREKYDPKGVSAANSAATSLQNAIKSQFQAYGDEGAKLTQQLADFQQYGRAVESTTRSVLEFDLARGKLKGTSAGVAERLRAEADALDAQKRALSQEQEGNRIDRRVAAIKAAADAQALSNREARIAQELAQIDTGKLPAGTAAYEARAAAIRQAVNADEDRLTVKRLADQALNTEAEVARLQQETAALTQNALQRQIATYQLKLEAEARREIAASPEMESEIRASKAAELQRYTVAATAAYDSQRSSVNGLRQAVARYTDEATDGARVAASVFQDTATMMENAIANFVKTGKLDVKGLFDFMLQEFVRVKARMAISSLASGTDWSGMLTTVASAFGGGGAPGGGAGAASAIYALTTGSSGGSGNGLKMPAFAGGGDPYVNRINLVGEQGPELFVPRVPGTIIPNRALSAMGGPSVQIVQNNNIGSQIGRSDLENGLVAAKSAAVSEVFDLLRRQGYIK